MTPENPSFHSHHSPIGALASFTCGAHNASGGIGIALSKPYEGTISIGYQDEKGRINQLPFFEGAISSESERYVQDNEKDESQVNIISNIQREYLWASDRFLTPQMDFKIFTPFESIPDPDTATNQELKHACCPAIHARITFRNNSSGAWKGFFGLGIDRRWTELNSGSEGIIGASTENKIGFATNTKGASGFSDFSVKDALNRQHTTDYFLLGPTAGIMIDIPAGQKKSLDIVMGVCQSGIATFNREMSYYYTRHFTGITDVLNYGIENKEAYLDTATKRDKELNSKPLNDEQKFLIAHATRSYYGSTQWLYDGAKSVWVVNEGEYLMMNTFDLTVDMLFFEMKFNPWTVKNTLNYFKDNYAYYDQVFSPDDPETLYPGGISFTHDMGVMNQWSPQGRSSYEVGGLDRLCFSHMTCEQLTNWVLCAGVYISQTNDEVFLRENQSTLIECLRSLQNRDNPTPEKRNGIMGFESSRTQPGGEITTYDSLDHSLGMSRNNIYLGGKMWASYLALHNLLNKLGFTEAASESMTSAHLAAETMTGGYNIELGFIPAVLEGDNKSAIIPAIEALVFPYEMNLREYTTEEGPFGGYIKALKNHIRNTMNIETCLYEDMGWKLSSSADNSWMSKISLCQYVAREVLGFDFGDDQNKTDLAHARWQREGSTKSACSDQFRSGIAHGSLYYPRIVTNILWLKETPSPNKELLTQAANEAVI